MLPESAPVLLVDDDADDRFLVGQAWKGAGIAHPLEALGDGKAALDRLEASYAGRAAGAPPALLLLDVKMPGLDGFDVLERVRGAPRLRRLPVLMLSASNAPSDVSRAYELGANAYFVKPSTLSDLTDLLAAVDACWLRRAEFPPRGSEVEPPGHHVA